EVAATLRLMLTGATAAHASGEKARIPGFLVAGKTGTAQKVNPNARGYLKGSYISSFAGFIPANQPRFVIFVAVDNPKDQFYGSQVAAPLFARIASYAVRQEGLSPTVLSADNIIDKAKTSSRKK